MFAKELRERRKAAGLSQQGLADRVQCSVGSVRSWEQGLRSPGLNMALALNKVLGVPLEVMRKESAL